MIKESVRKPFTVLVAVIMIIALGFVSLSSMTLDLLPEFSLPYMIVITTYPGAGPEKVEASVSSVMESALGTISGVKNITSSSSENYSMVQLEFEDDTDMAAVLVKVSNAINSVESYLPEEAGTPSIIEVSMDMMATVYLGISYTGKDMYDLTDFVEDELTPYLERQDGVASISSVGLVEKSVQIEINSDKVDDLNDKILALTDKEFAKAYQQIVDAKQQLIDSQAEIDENIATLEESKQTIADNRQTLADNRAELQEQKDDMPNKWAEYNDSVQELDDAVRELNEQQWVLENNKKTLANTLDQLPQIVSGLEGSITARDTLASQSQALTAGLSTSPAAYELTSPVAVAMPSQAMNVAGTIGYLTYPTNTTSAGALTMQLLYDPTWTVSDAIASTAALQAQYVGTIAQLESSYNAMRTAAGLTAIDLNTDANLSPAAITTSGGVKTIEQQMPALWSTAMSNLNLADTQLESAMTQLKSGYTQLDAAKEQLESADEQFEDAEEQLDEAEKQIDDAEEQLNDGYDQIADAQQQIDDGWDSYYDSLAQFKKQREQARKTANADQLVDISTLATLIYAQNFEMPAGYIDDENDNSWMLKVGQNFEDLETLGDTVITNIKDIGDIKLSDVADLTIIDTAGDSYAKMNGDDAILLSIFKSSTASTNAVSENIKEAAEELEERYPGLKITTLMDQGDYINILTSSVLESMVIGAALAIIILAIFMKDFKPTLVVAISIPLSVLLAIVCMYFSGITLNMMTLAGLALGIGMLVDNSIVVIENIYRLRGLGYTAAQAAVTGTRQVAAPIISSTLTTICVFLPILFATGMVRELILPMCLTVTFCLCASLLIAMTVVPAAGSTLLRNSKEKEHHFFDRIMDKYGKSLSWCLKHKFAPLALAILLLAGSVWEVVRMGIVMIPDMSTEPISVTVTVNEELSAEDSYAVADQLIEAMLTVDGVETIGAMPSNVMTSMIASTSTEADPHEYIFYIMMGDDSAGAKEIEAVKSGILEATKDIENCELEVSSSNIDMSSLTGSGLSVYIYGTDMDTLLEVADDVKAIVAQVPGYTNITDDQVEGDEVVHLVIDKDEAMRHGLTVAQLYQTISSKLTTQKSSTTMEISGTDMSVIIKNANDPLTLENLLDYTIDVQETDDDGDSVLNTYKLSDFASVEYERGYAAVQKKNLAQYITVTAEVEDGQNATLLSRQLEPLLEEYQAPDGYRVELSGESDTVNDMVLQMAKMLALGFLFIYLVMVAQFQSLLSPFIILFTIPLAFTGGLIGLWATGEQLTIMSLMGFMILMGTVVNNGIVFVDYTNQLRIEGKERRDALIETGKTRMRPILMTALTTILAMAKMVMGSDMASQMGKGMSIVIMGGLLYATLMTLYIVPVIYDMLFKKQPLNINVE